VWPLHADLAPREVAPAVHVFEQQPNLMPRFNIAPTQDVPIVRLTRDGTRAS
jgi:putative SOS response-associated peptidase YedK